MSVEKVALITAGGSGMGAGAAKKLAADGFKVAILSSSGKGEALAKELGGFGVTGTNQSVDDLAQLVDGAMERWGRVDVLVNSAGHGPKGDILEMTDDDWHQGMDVYLMNVIRPTRLVTPIMAAQGGGAIINISTFAAFEPHIRDFPRGACWVRQALRRSIRRQEHPHEQRLAGVHRQPARNRRPPRAHPHGPVWHRGRGLLPHRLVGVRPRRLCHRSELAHRRRADSCRLI